MSMDCYPARMAGPLCASAMLLLAMGASAAKASLPESSDLALQDLLGTQAIVESPSRPMRVTGLRAEHVMLQQGSDHVRQRSQLLLSDSGMRIDQQGQGFRFIADHVRDEFWMVDHRRGVAHQLPLASLDAGPVDGAYPEATMLVTTPCQGLVATESHDAHWRGRPVSISTCLDAAGEPVVRHWYSAEIGLVVRSLTPDGRIEELRNIQPAALPIDTFSVDPSIRHVGIEEFLLGTMDIGRFIDTEPDFPQGLDGRISQQE